MGIQIGFGLGNARRGTGGGSVVVLPPEAPQISYLINGTGTEATVLLSASEDYTGGTILTTRYSIDGGTPVEVFGAGPLDLTGLSSTQDLEIAWANSAGYSNDVLITLIASPPTFASGDWSIADAATAGGDGLTVTITLPPQAPLGLSILATQYSVNSGAWATLPVDGEIATGVPETLASVRLRTLYDVGPSVPATAKTATPTFEPVITDFANVVAEVFSTGATNQSSISATIPTHTPGMPIFAAFGVDGAPTVTITEDDWVLTKLSAAADDVSGNLYMVEKVAASSSETLTINFSVAENAVGCVFVGDGARDIVVSAVDENSSTSSRVMNSPGVTFGATEKAVGIVFYAQRGEETGPTEPTGWGTAVITTSSVTSAGSKFGYSILNSEASSIDPPAWTGNARRITTAMAAFLPTAGVPPVTAVTVGVSATSIAAGETVTWSAEADGRVPITYELTCDGSTTSNTTGDFTRTLSAGVQGWTLTATNAGGTDSATGSITVDERLVYTINPADPFEIVVEADSLVSGASYDLEWQTTDGGTATTVTQSSPDFTINLPDSGAYRFRVRADGGAWSVYGTYAVQVSGAFTYRAENVQSIQINPLTVDGPVEAVRVSGKLVKLFEIYPPVETEDWVKVDVTSWPHALSGTGTTYQVENSLADGSASAVKSLSVFLKPASDYRFRVRALKDGVTGDWSDWKYVPAIDEPDTNPLTYTVTTHYLNGVSVNPSAFAGYGPHAFDSRSGGNDGIRALHGGFDVSLLQTTWPVSLGEGGTVKKCKSRPTALLAGGNEGGRSGQIDFHSGFVVVPALSTAFPLQAPPAIIKETSWTGGVKDLPGLADMEDALIATTLSTTGLTLPESVENLMGRFMRFNPSQKLLRGGTWYKDDNECFAPYKWYQYSINYYAYITDQLIYALWLTGLMTADQKRASFRQEVLRGGQIDIPGSRIQIGAGISQDYFMPISLYRLARGLDFDDLINGQEENFPYMYGYLDATTKDTWFDPHTDADNLPRYALWRPVTSVLADDAIGSVFTCTLNLETNWDRKQRVGGLEILRESGERLVHRSGTPIDIDRTANPAKFGAIGYWETPLVPGELICFQLPAAARANMVEGAPFWMYTALDEPGRPFNVKAFNPAETMSYRDKQENKASIMVHHALGTYPTTAGGRYQAAKDYALKTIEADWPGPSPMNYGSYDQAFITGLFTAHATTLGITT